MRFRWWIFGSIIAVILGFGFIFPEEVERLYNTYSFVDDGAMIVDAFSQEDSITHNSCSSDFADLGRFNEGFFQRSAMVIFFPGSSSEEGGYIVEAGDGKATLEIDESCTGNDGEGLLVFEYKTNKRFPRFSRVKIPILAIDGEFRIDVDFRYSSDYFDRFDMRYMRKLRKREYSIGAFSNFVSSSSEVLSLPVDVIFDLNSSEQDIVFDWNNINFAMISFWGHGEISIGPIELIL